jgi:hypothetical protein
MQQLLASVMSGSRQKGGEKEDPAEKEERDARRKLLESLVESGDHQTIKKYKSEFEDWKIPTGLAEGLAKDRSDEGIISEIVNQLQRESMPKTEKAISQEASSESEILDIALGRAAAPTEEEIISSKQKYQEKQIEAGEKLDPKKIAKAAVEKETGSLETQFEVEAALTQKWFKIFNNQKAKIDAKEVKDPKAITKAMQIASEETGHIPSNLGQFLSTMENTTKTYVSEITGKTVTEVIDPQGNVIGTHYGAVVGETKKEKDAADQKAKQVALQPEDQQFANYAQTMGDRKIPPMLYTDWQAFNTNEGRNSLIRQYGNPSSSFFGAIMLTDDQKKARINSWLQLRLKAELKGIGAINLKSITDRILISLGFDSDQIKLQETTYELTKKDILDATKPPPVVPLQPENKIPTIVEQSL